MVCLDYTFHDETLFIAVNYLDRYLSTVKVTMRKQYHLLAIACVYLAAKYYEEIKEPCIADMVESAIDHIAVKDLKRMERKMMQALDWNFNVITPHVHSLVDIENLSSVAHSLYFTTGDCSRSLYKSWHP